MAPAAAKDCARWQAAYQDLELDEVERALAALSRSGRGDACTSAHAAISAFAPSASAPSRVERAGFAASCDSGSVSRRSASAESSGSRRKSKGSTAGAFDQQCATAARVVPPELTAQRLELEAEAAALRAELREAEGRLRTSTSAAAHARVAARSRRDRQQHRLQEAEALVEKLQRDNRQLEKSEHQASAEERRLAELLKAEPRRAEAALEGLRADCQRLEKENEQLLAEVDSGKAELSSVRDVVLRESQRAFATQADVSRAPFAVRTAPSGGAVPARDAARGSTDLYRSPRAPRAARVAG